MRENVIKVPPMSVNKTACEATQQWDTKLEKEIIAIIKMSTCYTYIGFSMGEPSFILMSLYHSKMENTDFKTNGKYRNVASK